MIRRVLSVAILGALAAAACGSDATTPTPVVTIPKSLELMCPVAQNAESSNGLPIPVTYQLPTPTGGVAPVTTTCTPVAGTPFALGSTPVTCTARDNQQHAASCTFNVSVTRPGTLGLTRFLAFGDSMTEGSLAACQATSLGRWTRELFLQDVPSIRAAVNVPTLYPNVLQGLLTTRYVSQTPTVTNVGRAGEFLTDTSLGTNDTTMARLVSEMTAYTPQVVLLLEGANDLNANRNRSDLGGPAIVKGLRDLAREARSRGAVNVFIATLLPQQPASCRGLAPQSVAPVNDQIRAMVAADRHALVDLYAALGGVPAPLIGPDGLHPTQAGYQRIAQTFFDVVRVTVEIPR